MNQSLDRSFGILIAYILPGFLCLAGASYFSPTISGWMSVAPSTDPTVGGFLYVALGSLAAGLVISGFRWLLVDALLHATGLKQPDLDFSKVQDKFEAFQLAVEHNYRYYQFYSNAVLAAAFFGICDQWSNGRWPLAARRARPRSDPRSGALAHGPRLPPAILPKDFATARLPRGRYD